MGYGHENNITISIHAPRTGSDSEEYKAFVDKFKSFQSTLPARGATADAAYSHIPGSRCISIHAPRTGSDSTRRRGACASAHFNPRSPHGERQINPATMHGTQGISIHAPRTGSDLTSRCKMAGRCEFQSTLPARGATGSICAATGRSIDFNPRSPHGERRPRGILDGADGGNFNPRSPHGERRNDRLRRDKHGLISIHAPRTGSDGRAGHT